MIHLIDGNPGDGKSLLLADLLHKRWKAGASIWPNFNLYFSPDNERIEKWQDFDEVLDATGGDEGGVIAVDEAYKVFDCRRSLSLPVSFSEKIAEHRHDGLDLYTATQNFSDLDKRVRDKVHTWYHCHTLLRIPRDQGVHPILQIIQVRARQRFVVRDRSVFRTVAKRTMWVSRYWTRKLYDSYSNLKLSKFLWRLRIKDGKAVLKIASRQAINSRKVRGW